MDTKHPWPHWGEARSACIGTLLGVAAMHANAVPALETAVNFNATNIVTGAGFSFDKFIGIDKGISGGVNAGVLSLDAQAHVKAGVQLTGRAATSTANIDFGGSVGLSADISSSPAGGQMMTLHSTWKPSFGQMATIGPDTSFEASLPVHLDARVDGSLLGFKRKLFSTSLDETLFSLKTPSGNSTTRYQSTFLDVVANRPELKGSGGLGADGFVTGVIVFFLQIDTVRSRIARRDKHLQNRPFQASCAFGAS